MHTKVLRGLRIRDTPILDQPNSLKLELPCKLPSLHDSPPVPSKHLTRCPRNRVQASRPIFSFDASACFNPVLSDIRRPMFRVARRALMPWQNLIVMHRVSTKSSATG